MAANHLRAGRRTKMVLLGVLIPIWAATAVAAVLLWPRGTPPTSDLVVTTGAGGETVAAVVRSASAQECPGTSTDRLPDGSIPGSVTCASVLARITSGPDRDQQVTVAVPAQVYRAGIEPGDRIDLTRFPPLPEAQQQPEGAELVPGAQADGDVYAWVDYSRDLPLGLLAAVFAVLVVLVARLRGLAALAGLALAGLAVGKFMLPALRLGEHPVAVALVGSNGVRR